MPRLLWQGISVGKENLYVRKLKNWTLGFLVAGSILLLLGVSAMLIPEIGYRPVFGLVSSLLALSVLTHLLKLFVLSVIEEPSKKSNVRTKKEGITMNPSKTLTFWSLGLFGGGVILYLAPILSYSLLGFSSPIVDLAGMFAPSLMFLGLLAQLLKLASVAIGEALGKKP